MDVCLAGKQFISSVNQEGIKQLLLKMTVAILSQRQFTRCFPVA